MLLIGKSFGMIFISFLIMALYSVNSNMHLGYFWVLAWLHEHHLVNNNNSTPNDPFQSSQVVFNLAIAPPLCFSGRLLHVTAVLGPSLSLTSEDKIYFNTIFHKLKKSLQVIYIAALFTKSILQSTFDPLVIKYVCDRKLLSNFCALHVGYNRKCLQNVFKMSGNPDHLSPYWIIFLDLSRTCT